MTYTLFYPTTDGPVPVTAWAVYREEYETVDHDEPIDGSQERVSGGWPTEAAATAEAERLQALAAEPIARRATASEAREAFEAGRAVIVREFGDVETMPATGTKHTRDTTTWDELDILVRMWRHRHPDQTFYVVEEVDQ